MEGNMDRHRKDSMEFFAGATKVHVLPDAASMGLASARLALEAMHEAHLAGKKPVLWLMAAPSGFAFYRAFVDLCAANPAYAALCAETEFFQFDDYPIARGDRRFPITFRHLLESRLFEPLERVVGELKGIHLLELGQGDEHQVAEAYARRLLAIAEDPKTFLVQLKGIGMDGHWGFHGSETPLDRAPGIIRVPMNEANIHQQMLDWPEYFHKESDVPRHAYTCDVALFLKARLIIDNVPQTSKMYSVLATYGTDEVIQDIPSSAIKRHPNSHAFLTADSAAALLELRRIRAHDPAAHLSEEWLRRLDALWGSEDTESAARNIAIMRRVLRKLGVI